jgi:hypothetical protein
MSTQETDQNAAPPAHVSWRSPEIIGEIILLLIVLGLAIYYLFEMSGLKTPARWLPGITIGFATPFWIIRARALVQRKHAMEKGQIMDLGFRFGGDPVAERRRALRYIASVAALFLGAWIFGFHITLPLWVMSYLFLFAKMKPMPIAIIGVAFEGLLLGVHDFIIDVPWPEPLFFRLIQLEYFFNDWPISDTF